MKCPFCHVVNDRVLDSRTCENGYAIRRRRQCRSCGRRFTTFERPEPVQLKVIKRDGSREPFDRKKLKRSLEIACGKRPVSDAKLEQVVSEIENRLYSEFDSEVESRFIGELAMEQLRELDQVAYVRFASVYRSFQEVSDFLEEIKQILGDGAFKPRRKKLRPPRKH
ncbi:MAG: transcriptional regulator NrdR [Thermoguttaceae bacterium]|nr:transcriptional regulator NrdR [Thermoguttaceae bacterium]MDW8079480.1 transcriptional regulator NrdR [Thermoguttaceae bacterium]